jgi:hypothetical protein
MATTANHQVVVNAMPSGAAALVFPQFAHESRHCSPKDRITSLTNENSILGWTGWWEAAKRRFSN